MKKTFFLLMFVMLLLIALGIVFTMFGISAWKNGDLKKATEFTAFGVVFLVIAVVNLWVIERVLKRKKPEKQVQNDMSVQKEAERPKPKKPADISALYEGCGMCDDPSYIREMVHKQSGEWHIYYVQLVTSGYGWENIVRWADYMASSDLLISTLVTGTEGKFTVLIDEYKSSGARSLTGLDKLWEECGTLAIGGISLTLKFPVRITWFNQTNTLRFEVLHISDENLMRRYIETAVRRTFGTSEEMKLAKPYTS